VAATLVLFAAIRIRSAAPMLPDMHKCVVWMSNLLRGSGRARWVVCQKWRVLQWNA